METATAEILDTLAKMVENANLKNATV